MGEAKFPYQAVADALRAKIAAGEITGKLPSRAKLADEYGVADMTIGAALAVLKDEGLVYGVRGLGVFVK
jgi:GntR family transcriptional regulator